MDARVKKDKQLEKFKKLIWTPSNISSFLNVRPFSPGGFFTFLVTLAHDVSSACTSFKSPTYIYLRCGKKKPKSRSNKLYVNLLF